MNDVPTASAASNGETDEALRWYVRARTAVADALHEAAETLGDCPAAHACQRLLVRLAADRFELVVLGQFKRGKSSLINAILGSDVLPTGMLPLTSAVTSLCHGERPRVLVRTSRSALPEQEPLSSLADFVTEPGNPGNAKGVVSVEVELPARFLRRGIRFVDTPGVGSMHQENTALTYSYLPEVDAALFVTSVESPLGETEVEFLDAVREHARKFFLVVNKADQLEPEAREEVVNFVRVTVEERLGTSGLRVFPVSARQALRAKRERDPAALEASGVPALERVLSTFLDSERRAVFLAAMLQRAVKALDGERAERELRRRAAEDPRPEAERLADFRQQVAGLEDARKSELTEARRRLDNWRATWLRRRLDSCAASAREDLGSRLADGPTRVVHSVIEGLGVQAERWERDEVSAAESFATELAALFVRRLVEILAQLTAAAESVVGQTSTDGLAEPFEWTPPAYQLEASIQTPRRELLGWLRFKPLRAVLGTRAIARRLAPRIVALADGVESRLAGHVSAVLDELDVASARAFAREAERLERHLAGPPPARGGREVEQVAGLQARMEQLSADILRERPEGAPVWMREERSAAATPAVKPSAAPAHGRRAAAGGKGCVVCGAVVGAVFDMLCQRQYATTIDSAARRAFLANGGWCATHFWQAEAISSARGLSTALPALAEQVGDHLRRLRGLPVGAAAPRLANLLPGPDRCPACLLRTRVEQEAVQALLGQEASNQAQLDWVPDLCLGHAGLLVTGLSGSSADAVIEALARRMIALSEAMQAYVLKVDARQRALLSRSEQTAYVELVALLAGRKHLLAPLHVD